MDGIAGALSLIQSLSPVSNQISDERLLTDVLEHHQPLVRRGAVIRLADPTFASSLSTLVKQLDAYEAVRLAGGLPIP